jgi:hypothetical protein
MAGPIARFLKGDHARLDALLASALARPEAVDLEAFGAFRAGLLRHIAVEEKILLPAAREARGGEPLPLARRLRIDHGAITSLLVPTPTPAIAAELRSILGPHDAAEEEPGGLYETCDALLAPSAAELVARMEAYPQVKLNRYQDGPTVHRTAESALAASARQFERKPPFQEGGAMPLTLEEIVGAYEAGAATHRNGKPLAEGARALWAAAQAPGDRWLGTALLRDAARRQWGVDVRRDGRGRYLQLRPIGIDIERFRASADGYKPAEWLPVAPLHWTAFALFAGGAHGGEGHAEDEELFVQVRRLLDRMVRDAQHQGLVFDEDED